ncbi:MAG: hypothetical protein JWL83_4732, partial [Actinomycetia bacterium]|nr:hypothetical protein [Actinomycetes bacterium]
AHAGTAGQQAGASKLKWIGSITGGTAVATIFTQLGTLFRRARTLVETAQHEVSRFRKLNAKVRAALITVVGGLFGPAALVAGLLLIVNAAATRRLPTRLDVVLWAAVLVAAAVVVACSDIVAWSMHPYYKRRLASAFVVKRATAEHSVVAREIDSRDVLLLSDLKRERMQVQFPELLVCAAANVSDGGATPPGSAVTSFVFSPTMIGGPLVGEMPTETYERELSAGARIHVSVPAAIAISGAALSPAMGKLTRRSARFLLALGNVRLGVWVPNPRRVEHERTVRAEKQRLKAARRKRANKRGKEIDDEQINFGSKNAMFAAKAPPRYLLNEVFGRHRISSRFVYLSDGGHYENLGLVELLRRGCTQIFCFDASGGHAHDNETLRQAIALARSELGVEIGVTPTFGEPAVAPDGVATTSSAAFDFVYPRVDGSPQVRGRLYYVRTEVTADDPWDVRVYTKADAEFPYHPTIDQAYTGERFEAYRVLGRSAARALLQLRAQDVAGAVPDEINITDLEDEYADAGSAGT